MRRELIIESLRSCAKNESCAKRCVYGKESFDCETGKACLDMLMDQAADMLEQDEKPNRVLTLKEALKSEEPVWRETPDRGLRIVSIHVAEHPDWAEWHEIGRTAPFIAPLAEYNKTWRCWLRKPTADEIQKEKWEK